MSARDKLAAEVSRELIEELARFDADGPLVSRPRRFATELIPGENEDG